MRDAQQAHPAAGLAVSIESAIRDFCRSHFGVDDYGCRLCQTAVPCESTDPTR